MVAVSPAAQGRGVGRKLFEVVLGKADEGGFGCYLESSKRSPNVRIYERFGFVIRAEMECVDGGDGCMVCSLSLGFFCGGCVLTG